MAYSVVPTVATGDLWTAANHNTYVRDNFSAAWPYTTAGDLAYASSATTLGRLGVGTAFKILSSDGSIPAWKHLADIIQIGVSGAISTDTTSTSYVDMTGATVSLTLNRQSSVIAFLYGTVSADAAAIEYIKLLIGSDSSPEVIELMNNDFPRNFMVIHYAATVAAGAVTIKAQYKSDVGVKVNFYNGKILVLAIPKA